MDEQKEKQMDDEVRMTEKQEENEQRMEEKRDQSSASTMEEEFVPFFVNNEAEKFRSQWLDIQSRFVDDPRDSVKKADELVEDVINNITKTFAQERTSLENQWTSGDNVSTEDLRVAIKRYRSFFNRLLTLES